MGTIGESNFSISNGDLQEPVLISDYSGEFGNTGLINLYSSGTVFTYTSNSIVAEVPVQQQGNLPTEIDTCNLCGSELFGEACQYCN